MQKTILLLLMAVVAYGQIHVSITASGNNDVVAVHAEGNVTSLVSDEDIKVFRLHDGELDDYNYTVSSKHFSCNIDRYPVFYPEVKRYVYPKIAQILKFNSEWAILWSQEFINNSSVKAKYSARVSRNVENTVKNTWTKDKDIFSLGQNISYGVNFKGYTASLSYTHSWGEERTHSKVVTLASPSAFEVELKPGEVAVAKLYAVRGYINMRVEYFVAFFGGMSCYQTHYKNDTIETEGPFYLRWHRDVKTTKFDFTEFITLRFFSEARIEVVEEKPRLRVLNYAPVHSV